MTMETIMTIEEGDRKMNKTDHKAFSFPYPVVPDGWNDYDDNIDYCGPAHQWYSKYLSRYIIGVDCNKVYWAHDNRYRLGETGKDREFADKQMRRDQNIAICRAFSWWHPLRYPAMLKAFRRYNAVSCFGKGAFNSKG